MAMQRNSRWLERAVDKHVCITVALTWSQSCLPALELTLNSKKTSTITIKTTTNIESNVSEFRIWFCCLLAQWPQKVTLCFVLTVPQLKEECMARAVEDNFRFI